MRTLAAAGILLLLLAATFAARASSSHYPYRYGFPNPPGYSHNPYYYFNYGSWRTPLDQRTAFRYEAITPWHEPAGQTPLLR